MAVFSSRAEDPRATPRHKRGPAVAFQPISAAIAELGGYGTRSKRTVRSVGRERAIVARIRTAHPGAPVSRVARHDQSGHRRQRCDRGARRPRGSTRAASECARTRRHRRPPGRDSDSHGAGNHVPAFTRGRRGDAPAHWDHVADGDRLDSLGTSRPGDGAACRVAGSAGRDTSRHRSGARSAGAGHDRAAAGGRRTRAARSGRHVRPRPRDSHGARADDSAAAVPRGQHD
jgi:hypothetical protein